MKMSAEFACGQILFNLKHSNLHYVIKETHMSADITIRKKFIKETEDPAIMEGIKKSSDNVTVRIDEKVRMENGLLKQEINTLKTEYANIEIKKEETDMKNETLNELIATLRQKLDAKNNESRKIKAENATLNDELKTKDEKMSHLKGTVSELKASNEKHKVVQRNSEEDILMLESIVQSKSLTLSNLEAFVEEINKQQIERGMCENCENAGKTIEGSDMHKRTEHIDDDIPSTSKCGKCLYESDDESDMNIHINLNHRMNSNSFSCEICSFESNIADILTKHMDENHTIKCDHCDFTTPYIKTLDLHLEETHKYKCNNCNLTHNDQWKHKIHICKVDIENPTFKTFYSKAWCSERNEDVLWLHNDKCWSGEIPCHFTPHIYFGKVLKASGPKHCEYSKFVTDNKICWPALSKDI